MPASALQTGAAAGGTHARGTGGGGSDGQAGGPGRVPLPVGRLPGASPPQPTAGAGPAAPCGGRCVPGPGPANPTAGRRATCGCCSFFRARVRARSTEMSGGAASWLGLARAAGKLALGHWQCRRALANGQAVLVVIATDTSPSARRRLAALAERAGCRWVAWGDQAELGHAVGAGPKAVVAFLDPGLAAHFLGTASSAPRTQRRARRTGGRGDEVEEDPGVPAGQGAQHGRQGAAGLHAEPR